MLRKMHFIFYSARHMRENYFILNDYEKDDDVAGWRDTELKLRQVHQMAAQFQRATCSVLHLHSHSHLVATMPYTEPELELESQAQAIMLAKQLKAWALQLLLPLALLLLLMVLLLMLLAASVHVINFMSA